MFLFSAQNNTINRKQREVICKSGQHVNGNLFPVRALLTYADSCECKTKVASTFLF